MKFLLSWASRLTSRPTSESARPAHPVRLLACSRAPRGGRTPSTPVGWRPVAPARALSRCPSTLSTPLLLYSILSPAAAAKDTQASSATARTRALAGVSCFSHHRSPPAATSRPEHRLHLVHPALASVSRGKAPFDGNRSSEHGRAHRRAPLPWTPPLPLSFHAHEHRTVSRLLLGTSIYHAVAGNAPPATTRAAAPPCTAVASLLSSTDHRTYTKRFAG
jgi:hypothetical protein